MSKHIFETGDKVKLVDTDTSPAQNRALGKTGTVCYSPTRGYSEVQFEGESSSLHVLNARLEHVSDLETLVARANDGIKAMQELAAKHAGKTDFVYDSGQVVTIGNPSSWAASVRIAKPKVPPFAPFTTSNGWKVELKGDRLHVGCENFDVNALKDALKHLLDLNWCAVGYHALQATRKGLHTEGHTLPWADAERIYEELKRAGV